MENLLLFIGASLALLITPGPAVLYIVTQSLSQGAKAGVYSSLGIGIGGLIHVVAAALGLSAILAASATAFTFVKLLGAAYLIYLGIQKIRHAQITPSETSDETTSKSMRQLFIQGVWVNILNPKTALFFLAFCPQFINPTTGSAEIQMLILGALFLMLALTTDMLFALFAGKIHPFFSKGQQNARRLNVVAGSIYILLGIAAAFGSKK